MTQSQPGEMIERMARAIAPDAWASALTPGVYDDFWRQGARQTSLRQARAVLTAMREPTPGMIEEGWAAITIPESPCPSDVWHSMIDAALAGDHILTEREG